MMRWVFIAGIVLLCGLPRVGRCQEHPFIFAYELTEFSGGIGVDWTLMGGSTCNGQDIERSTNGVDFIAVHRILGICGDPEVAVPFNWFDGSPPEFSTVHYRVKLGFDGYSSVKTIRYDQLTTSDQRFFPSPMQDEATLLLSLDAGTLLDLFIWDPSGKMVADLRNTVGPAITLSLPDLGAGVYSYRAIGGGKVFDGRFVKQ